MAWYKLFGSHADNGSGGTVVSDERASSRAVQPSGTNSKHSIIKKAVTVNRGDFLDIRPISSLVAGPCIVQRDSDTVTSPHSCFDLALADRNTMMIVIGEEGRGLLLPFRREVAVSKRREKVDIEH